MRSLWMAGAVLLVVVGLPGRGRADVSHVIRSRLDDRGGAVHVVPLDNDQVRMVAERVVLVPYYEPTKWQPRLLVHVWYDLRNEGKATRLQLGFPELQALYRAYVENVMAMVKSYEKLEQHWKLPTILELEARVGAQRFPVATYPGVGPYRRWHTFGLELGAGQTVRLHTTYVATLGSTEYSMDGDEDDPRKMMSWFLHYVLHTGARWRGAIGQGEIYVYAKGRRRLVRRWKDLEPTGKDDVSLTLDLTVDRAYSEPAEELAPGEYGHRNPPGQRLDRRRLLSASTTLASPGVDTHVGLVVDGDPGTGWVSAKGRGVGAQVQLPSNPDRDLTALRVVSGTPGPGRVRPAKVVVQCQAGWRRKVLASADLPDAPGPHAIALAKPARCDALRVEVRAVHGDKTASVAIAEVEQRFGKEDLTQVSTDGYRTGPSREDPLRPPREGLGSAKQPLPAADDPRAFEIADLGDVSWSADGSLVHYRLHLENRRQRARGVRLGYFADVATGKVVRAYRLDRHGDLPEPYRRHWDEAMPFEAGAAVLAKHGFQAARASRWAPRRSALPGQGLRLVGAIQGEPKALVVRPARDGFRWRYSPRSYQAKGPATASLALQYAQKGQPERALTTRAPALDRGFAGRHATVWPARRAIFEVALKEYLAARKQVGQETTVTEDTSKKWHALTYRNWQAYQGEARVFWHPKGEALLVYWSDQKDYSAAVPDPKPEEVMPECAELPVTVCPWERRDDVRQTVAVTLHALVPRPPTTLLAAYQPPAPPPRPALAASSSSSAAKAAALAMAMARATPASGSKAAPAKTSGGCGCNGAGPAGDPGAGALLGLIALLGLGVVRRRRAARVKPRG